jgi:ankyrin repeat protein
MYIYTFEYKAEDEQLTGKFSTFLRLTGNTAEIAYLPEDPKRFWLAELLPDTLGNKISNNTLPMTFVVLLIVFVFIFIKMFNFYSAEKPQANANAFVNLCRKGTVAQIEAKIKTGADVNASNKDGVSPFFMAAADNSNPEVLNVLIQAGANINKGDLDRALLSAARYNSNPEVSSFLIQAGADINAKDSLFGETPLMKAAMSNKNPEVSLLLIQAGSDVEAKDKQGRTPLILVAGGFAGVPLENKIEVLETLIKAGANVNAKNKEGETVLDLAKRRFMTEYVQLLEAAGAR